MSEERNRPDWFKETGMKAREREYQYKYHVRPMSFVGLWEVACTMEEADEWWVSNAELVERLEFAGRTVQICRAMAEGGDLGDWGDLSDALEKFVDLQRAVRVSAADFQKELFERDEQETQKGQA